MFSRHSKYAERKTEGFALIDALVALAIGTAISSAFIGTIYQSSISTEFSKDRLIASMLSLETYEVMVSLAQKDFDLITDAAYPPYASDPDCTTQCHVYINTSGSSDVWDYGSGSETVATRFERSFRLEEVYRNGSNEIDDTGSNLDPDTFKLIIDVSWTAKGETHSDHVASYLHRVSTP